MDALSIKDWAEDDRPRKKLLTKGKAALSNAELLGILLGSGSRSESAVSLAQRILKQFESLENLGRIPIEQLTQFNGIGSAKAASIMAAMELGRRRQLIRSDQKIKVTSSQLAYDILGPALADLPYEEFWIACLNRANQLLAKERISTGGIHGTVVDPKIVYSSALKIKASSIILYHNHPSGSLQPSQEDILITEKLRKAGKLLDITVLDHLIIGHGAYYSFKDEEIIT